MQAVRVSEHGGLEALDLVEVDEPEPGPGQATLRVHAVGLNHLDLWVRRGVAGHDFPLPLVTSSDAAGVVEQVGAGVEDLAPGDEVVVLPGVSCGRCPRCLEGRDNLCACYGILGESLDGVAAEVALVPARNLRPKPSCLDFVEAAAFPLVFLTAWNMVVRRARLRPGERALVVAGASGVGSAAIQIARLFGARVVATAGSDEKRETCVRLGAEEAFDSRGDTWPLEVLARGGVDVVVDHVGTETFASSLRCLVAGGRYVTCGATTGARAGLHLNALFFKNLSVLGSTMGRAGDLCRALDLAAERRLEPVVGRRLAGLASIAEGHRLLEGRAVSGKVVVALVGT